LIVEAGPDARRAAREQRRAVLRQFRLGGIVGARDAAQAVENDLAFPVAARRHVVKFLEARGARPERVVDLGLAPDIELAFLMLAVGVEARGKAAFILAHLARDPADRLGDALGIERA